MPKERRRFIEVVAAREALALKPLVVRRVPTCAVFPVRDVELPLGYLRQDSLQFFEPLNVHRNLPEAPRRSWKAYAPSLKAQASVLGIRANRMVSSRLSTLLAEAERGRKGWNPARARYRGVDDFDAGGRSPAVRPWAGSASCAS